MKILFSGESLYPPASGGDASILTLLEELAKKHDIEAICTGKRTEMARYKGIKIYRIKTWASRLPSWVKRYFLNKVWFSILDSHLKKRKYNLVISQAVLAPASVITAKKHGIPVLLFIRSLEHFCLSLFRDVEIPRKHNCLKHASWKYKIQYPFFRTMIQWHKKALKKADTIVCISKFVKNVAKNYGVKTDEIIQSSVKIENYRFRPRDKRGEYITFINPTKQKGVDIFLKIADKLPNQSFLVVGKTSWFIKLKLKKRGNIKYVEWTNDMKDVYSKTKILLVPSLIRETFSRVVVEAMCNGIPIIATNRGGLPEAVGNGGIIIKDALNIDIWTGKIKKLQNDIKLYKKLSGICKNRVYKFKLKKQVYKLKTLIEKEG